MKKNNLVTVAMALTVVSFLASCNKNEAGKTSAVSSPTAINALVSENGANPDEAVTNLASTGSTNSTSVSNLVATNAASERVIRAGGHYVYTEGNQSSGNQILSYRIAGDGTLKFVAATASGGNGTSAALGSQGALVIDEESGLLFAVNAGSNSVSSFRLSNDGSLRLIHTASSGGQKPTSVTVKRNLLYVLNAGSDSIQGFRVWDDGSFSAIEWSKQSLSISGAGGAQISFTPNADWLVVTEKATNKISSFKVKSDGSADAGEVTASTGVTPYGFDFSRDRFMIVSDAVGGAAGASTTTSYTIGGNGVPHAINGAVPDDQSAACWVAVTKYGRYAFVTNTASNTISSYYVSGSGSLTLVHQVAASTDNSPLDIIVAKNNYDVYELNEKSNTIGEYHRTCSGGLSSKGSVSGLPSGSAGLATF